MRFLFTIYFLFVCRVVGSCSTEIIAGHLPSEIRVEEGYVKEGLSFFEGREGKDK